MHRVVALLLALAACHPAASPHQPDHPALSIVDELARDHPEDSIKPLWPDVPEVIRTTFERPSGTKPETDQLAAAKRRLEHWRFQTTHADQRLRVAIEGLALAEPIAFAPASNPDRLTAAALLYRMWAELDHPAFVDWTKNVARSSIDRKLLEMTAEAAPAMRKHFAGVILHAREPEGRRSPAVSVVLRDVAERESTTNPRRSHDLYAALLRRLKDDAAAEDWIDAAQAAIRIDAVAEARDAATHAHGLAAKRPDDRPIQARVRGLDKDLVRLDKLLAAAKGSTIGDQVQRIDMMRELERGDDAMKLLDQLRKQHPEDARVRTRYAAATFENIATHGQALEGALQAATELEGDSLVNKDADYWSMLIGALGLRAMQQALPELQSNPQKAVDILTQLKTLATQLATSRPGRAAVLTMVVDRAIPLIEKFTHGDAGVLSGAMKTGLSDAVAVRTKYPDTADADHLVAMLAMFATDREAALAAVAVKPGTPADEDIDTYIQRARTGVSLAMNIATPAAVATARAIVLEIAPSTWGRWEGAREALLGDCDAIEATLTKTVSLWDTAEKHYLAARELDDEIEPRMLNNLAWILLRRGDKEHAVELFKASAELPSERQWLAGLNAVVASHPKSERLDMLRTLRSASKDAMTMLAWIAAESPNAKEASEAARDAVDDMTDSFHSAKLGAGLHGFDGDGYFQLGLGIGSRHFYNLETQAYASLWLMSPVPLDVAQLQAKAKTAKAAKPAKK